MPIGRQEKLMGGGSLLLPMGWDRFCLGVTLLLKQSLLVFVVEPYSSIVGVRPGPRGCQRFLEAMAKHSVRARVQVCSSSVGGRGWTGQR